MRPVARIAQSVEQGIENPRVLGSIPSPGTTFPFLCLPVNSHVYVIQKVSVKSFPDAFWFIPAYPENLGSDYGSFSSMNDGDPYYGPECQ